MAANGGSETTEVCVRRDFGGGKGAATGIQKAWKGQGTGGGTQIRELRVVGGGKVRRRQAMLR